MANRSALRKMHRDLMQADTLPLPEWLCAALMDLTATEDEIGRRRMINGEDVRHG